jgi:hypothetical protein
LSAAVQHDWEQFELLASELAAQLAAALQPHHTAQHQVGAGRPRARLAPESAPQQQTAVAEQQQEQLVELLGMAGVAPGGAAAAEGLGCGVGDAALTGVLSRLMEAPLAAR